MRPNRQLRFVARVLALAAVAGGSLVVPLSASGNDAYGYVRTLDGYADLIQSRSNEVAKLTSNYPVIEGDQVRVPARSRIEIVLADGSLVRLGANSDLEIRRMAHTAESESDSTLLLFHQGEAQVVRVDADSADPEIFRIDTVNATLYLGSGGRYRVFSDGSSWTEITARAGDAEIVAEGAATSIGEGQTLFIEGARDPVLRRAAAATESELELWGNELTRTGERYAATEVAPSLAYQSTTLYRHGSWIETDLGSAWRPRVSSGWRPYRSGWWGYTPSGLTWISTEPWGWLTYHYGLWDYSLAYGWVWRPGSRYTPAAVYWYWGPTYVGWIPAGYFDRHYRYRSPRYLDPYTGLYYDSYLPHGRYGRGSRYFYGAASGIRFGSKLGHGFETDHWQHWSFSRHDRLSHRSGHSHFRSHAELSNQGSFRGPLPEGLITRDTRALSPGLWRQPTRAMEVLRRADRPPARRSGPRIGLVDTPGTHDTWRTGWPSRIGAERRWGSDLRQSRLSRRPVVPREGRTWYRYPSSQTRLGQAIGSRSTPAPGSFGSGSRTRGSLRQPGSVGMPRHLRPSLPGSRSLGGSSHARPSRLGSGHASAGSTSRGGHVASGSSRSGGISRGGSRPRSH